MHLIVIGAKPKDGVEHACIYVICDPCRVSGRSEVSCVTRDRSDGRSSPHVQYRMFGLNTITIYLVQVEVQVRL